LIEAVRIVETEMAGWIIRKDTGGPKETSILA
jgi:hypothetical protein